MKRWVVESPDLRKVDDVLALLGEDLTALDDGRVFVGRVRAVRGAPLAQGDTVTVHENARAAADVDILFDRAGIVAAIKPAGIPTIADHAGARGSLVELVASRLGLPVSRVHTTSRLDRHVSGVVVLAVTEQARDHLARARASGRYGRRYVALTPSIGLPSEGKWDAPIGRGSGASGERARGKAARLRVASGADADPAETRFRVVARTGEGALLAVTPVTGRTHQIRVHASHAGAPLFGDRDYGGPTRVTLASGATRSLSRIALHCARVSVPTPGGGETRLVAPIPAELVELWGWLGGSESDWALAGD